MAKLLSYYGAQLPVVTNSGWNPIHCPFHQDSRASASVNLVKNKFFCHGVCEVSGDVLDVVQFKEKLSVREACDWLTERFM